MKLLFIIAVLIFFNCAQVNGSENFNSEPTNFNTPAATITPENIFTTPVESKHDTPDFQEDLTTTSDFHYANGNLGHSENLSSDLNITNKNRIENLFLKESQRFNKESQDVEAFPNEAPVEIEPTVQIIDKNATEEVSAITDNNHHTKNLISISFGASGSENNTNTFDVKKENENKKRHLNDHLNQVALPASANFADFNFQNGNPGNLQENQNFFNGNPSNLMRQDRGESSRTTLTIPPSHFGSTPANHNFRFVNSNPLNQIRQNGNGNGEAILTMTPPQFTNTPRNQNFENTVLTMVPPSHMQHNNAITTESQRNNNFNPILGSRSAFSDYDHSSQQNSHHAARNDQVPQNIQMPIAQSDNVARMLHTLEQKVENIADMVKKQCGNPIEPQENLVGSKQSPNNFASNDNVPEEKADLVNPSDVDDPKTQQGDVVGDINPDLLAEEDENSPGTPAKKIPPLFSRFGDKSKPKENSLTDEEPSRSINDGFDSELPAKKTKFTKLHDMFPKHKPLLRNHHPVRTGHGFAKKNHFFHPLTGAKRSPGTDPGFTPNKERVGDSFDDFEEEDTPAQTNPIEDFFKNTLHIPTMDELLKLAKLRNSQEGNAAFQNIKKTLPNLDPKRLVVQPKSLWKSGDDAVGSSRKAFPSLFDSLNQRPRLNLFKNPPIDKNLAAQSSRDEISNAGSSPAEGNANPSVPKIGERFGGEEDDDVLGSRAAQNPYTNLGRIVLPKNRPLSMLNPTDNVFFEGSGINLPLKVANNGDGSLQLSVDAEKLCSKCVGNACNDDVVGASQPKKLTLIEKLTSRMAENKNKPLVDPIEIKSRLLEKTEDFIGRRKSLIDSNNAKLQGIFQPKNDPPIVGQAQDKKLIDIPQMKARFAERTQNLLDQQKSRFENHMQTLFPKASQVAKRSPKLLFNSPLLSHNSLLDRNLENRDNYFEEYRPTVLKSDGSKCKKNNDKKDHIKKRVAIVKDVLNWVKDVGKDRVKKTKSVTNVT